MANKRIKDLGTTASTLAADDYVAIDGNANGTRKIVKGDLVNDISTQVAGTYLDEANNLSDVASKDTSKLNLEVPDVGTAPNEVPLNGQLGSMAFQSAEAVSAGTVSAESLEVTDKITTKDVGGVPKGQVEFQDSGYTISGGVNLGDIRHDAPRHRWYSGATVLAQFDEGTSYFQNTSLGIGTSSPGSLSAAANNLVVGSGTGNQGLTVFSGSANEAAIYFADGTAGNQAYRSYIVCQHASDNLVFGTAGATRWTINSTGNLVAGSGLGIDFGSAATSAGQGTNTTGSVSNSVLSDYEFGSWTPSFATSGADFAAITMDVIAAQYVKVGKHVHCQAYIRTDNVDRTGASGTVVVEGLPFVSDTSSGNYATLSVGYSSIWVNAPTAGYVQPNAAYAFLTRNGTTGISVISAASDITDGASSNVNELIFTISYIAST